MLAELTEVRKQYGNFQLNCTMQLEEGRITGLIGKTVQERVPRLKRFWD